MVERSVMTFLHFECCQWTLCQIFSSLLIMDESSPPALIALNLPDLDFFLIFFIKWSECHPLKMKGIQKCVVMFKMYKCWGIFSSTCFYFLSLRIV